MRNKRYHQKSKEASEEPRLERTQRAVRLLNEIDAALCQLVLMQGGIVTLGGVQVRVGGVQVRVGIGGFAMPVRLYLFLGEEAIEAQESALAKWKRQGLMDPQRIPPEKEDIQ
jgi:hypothetical protein